MGKLIDGVWHDIWYDTSSQSGKFVREEASFRHWISNETDSLFQPESGRYHLYVSLACPWAHRTLIFRHLKALDAHIDVTIVCPDMMTNGWQFGMPEPLYGHRYLHQIYTQAKPDYSGRVTVPVLWDKVTGTIVSNESADIIRIFNRAFNELTGNFDDYYPVSYQSSIDHWNDYIYSKINNGVYRCGFATTQQAYKEAYVDLFDALDKIDHHLATSRYLVGNHITEADWRLFTTLVRFDVVYVGHFKCNKKRIRDYPNLDGYLKELYQVPGIKETTDFYHIKRHYYYSHLMINPTQIVPEGPDIDLEQAHQRALVGH
jgi:putative glutathione S-transferase